MKVGEIWSTGTQVVEVVARESIYEFRQKITEVVAYRLLGATTIHIIDIEYTREWKQQWSA